MAVKEATQLDNTLYTADLKITEWATNSTNKISRVYCARQGNVITLDIQMFIPANNPNWYRSTTKIPEKFRPAKPIWGSGATGAPGGNFLMQIQTDGTIEFYPPKNEPYEYGFIEFTSFAQGLHEVRVQ